MVGAIVSTRFRDTSVEISFLFSLFASFRRAAFLLETAFQTADLDRALPSKTSRALLSKTSPSV